MNPASRGSTSRDEAESSKPWPEVVELGCRIVEEQKLQDSTETLSRWMAHRVAELIARGETGSEEDRQEATRLIVLLWDERAKWSEGWPPPATEAMRDYIAGNEREFPRRLDHPEPTTLLDVLRELGDLQAEERECWRSLVLTETSAGDEISAALEEEADLEEDQVFLFRSLAEDRKQAVEHFGSDDDPELQRAKRLAKLREDLNAFSRRRGALTKKGIALYEWNEETQK